MTDSQPSLDWSSLFRGKTQTTTQAPMYFPKIHFPTQSTNYTSTPRIRSSRTIRYPADIFELLCSTPKGARDLFIEIKQRMDYETHIAILPYKHLTPSQKNKRYEAIRALEKAGKGLARRVPSSGIINSIGLPIQFRPSTFMLSPEYIYPAPSFTNAIHVIWRQCAK